MTTEEFIKKYWKKEIKEEDPELTQAEKDFDSLFKIRDAFLD